MPAASPVRLWAMAARPRTLTISLAPILAAGAHAYAATGAVAARPLAAALVASAAIQIATNLLNDAADGERGHDGPTRLGPARVTALGLLSGGAVRRAALLCVGAASVCGAIAVAYGGWPILTIGLLSLAAGWAYSHGPAPISASPYGEIVVIAFFGLAAVVGATYLASPAALSAETFALGLTLGAPAAATLLVNNHRDRALDAVNGRRTLAILIGERGARRLYGALIAAAVALFAVLVCRLPNPFGHVPAAAVSTLAAIVGCALARRFARAPIGRELNALLARTAAFELLLAALYAVLAAMGRAV